MCMVERYDRLISKHAWTCLGKCAVGHTTFEDLKQEGMIVLTKLMKRKFDKNRAKFTTLLSSCLIRKYANIVRDSYRSVRVNSSQMDLSLMELVSDEDIFDNIRRKEVIEEVSKISPGLADMLANGVPRELFIRARNKARGIALKRQRNSKRSPVDAQLIEAFYGVNLKKVLNCLKISGV